MSESIPNKGNSGEKADTHEEEVETANREFALPNGAEVTVEPQDLPAKPATDKTIHRRRPLPSAPKGPDRAFPDDV